MNRRRLFDFVETIWIERSTEVRIKIGVNQRRSYPEKAIHDGFHDVIVITTT